MSDEKDLEIGRFIVRCIQDQNLPEENGVPAGRLVHLCLQKLCSEMRDAEAVRNEKKAIVNVIKHMINSGVLNRVHLNNEVAFRLDPYFNVKDKMNVTASQPSEDLEGTQEGLEALEKETSPDADDQQMEQGKDQLGQQAEEEVEAQLERQFEEEQFDRTVSESANCLKTLFLIPNSHRKFGRLRRNDTRGSPSES
jgi:hypothetical protein